MFFRNLQQWIWPSDVRDEVAIAQYDELRLRLPWLHALLALNAIAAGYNLYGIAPDTLTLWCPVALVSVLLLRLGAWLVRRRIDVDAATARLHLKNTALFAGVIAIGFVFWALQLSAYGGPLQKAHVAFFLAISVAGSIFCLASLPQAAILVTIMVLLPTLIHYLLSGDRTFAITAVNIALVTGVMIKVLAINHRTFVKLIESQSDLARINGQALMLSDENNRLANTDSLTNLPNRRYFFGRLENLIATGVEANGRFAIGLIDLDHFKPVNDMHGHIIGDQLLEKVGARLLHTAGPDVLVARLGGDEFAFIARGGSGSARAIAQRLCEALAEPFSISDATVALGASCGIAMYPDSGQTAQQLFDRADFALYEVKASGRGGLKLFSAEQEDRLRSERVVEAQLHSAALTDELHVQFQPVIDLNSRGVVFVESLARWTNALLGIVPPGQFIAVAEKTGLIRPMTLRLLEMALEQASVLPTNVGVSFNLSAHNIKQDDMIEAIASIVRSSGMSASRISFEITERVVMQDHEAAMAAMHRLKDLGAMISLDDFGTGVSSLAHLYQMPIDRVKVDRSLLNSQASAETRRMLAAISGLCESLRLECVVEGVESQIQLARLRAAGYRFAQGYLFAHPMSMPTLMAWMESGELHTLLSGPDARIEHVA